MLRFESFIKVWYCRFYVVIVKFWCVIVVFVVDCVILNNWYFLGVLLVLRGRVDMYVLYVFIKVLWNGKLCGGR